jgi:alpha 1,2-mannosyltransferase
LRAVAHHDLSSSPVGSFLLDGYTTTLLNISLLFLAKSKPVLSLTALNNVAHLAKFLRSTTVLFAMLITLPQRISTIPRFVALFSFLFICGFLLLPGSYEKLAVLRTSVLAGDNITEPSASFDVSVRQFWPDLAVALLESAPQCQPLELEDGDIGSMGEFLPLQPHKDHPDRMVGFTDQHEIALFRAHHLMRKMAQHLAPKVPFSKGTSGIVTTANVKYMSIFLVSLRMLRRTGCKMPVEVFINDWSNQDESICDTVLPSLNARCMVISDIYDKATGVKQPDHYQYKIFAILFSSFQNILFLDSDAFPAYDPTDLFTKAPYTTHGLVTWPDYWVQTISAHFYHIAAIPEVPSQSRLSTESGQLLLNKDLHRESLLMMVYYNYYGPDYYYKLLSQGSPGAGDKETFVQAALAVNLPYYQVRTAPGGLGRVINNKFKGTGILQADPTLDYAYLTPMRSHIHKAELWHDADLPQPNPHPDSLHKVPPKPKPLFIHQNTLKLDPAEVLRDKNSPTFTSDGAPHRMWGEKEDMEILIGYDIEARLWHVIAEEGCRGNESSTTCKELRHYVAEVFGRE